MDVYGQPLDRSGLLAHVGQMSQVAGVRLVTLADGAGRGTRLLEFRSGAGLAFEIIVDRAFDVGHASVASRDHVLTPGWDRFGPPEPGVAEDVTEIRPSAGADGRVLATVVNAEEDLAVYEHYRCDTLPYLVLWRMLGQGSYVVGLEPSTNGTAGRRDVRAKGELVVLEPGESREYDLVIGAHSGSDAVAEHLRRHS
ncbi:DUF4432 family protein [Candidatus Poriferisodalis sp.]|uniref:DUF4432 family protein n=1 Tax=Candidatus Poriferisodalis sp. TaxID=3101277 RepID=UPI003D1034F6